MREENQRAIIFFLLLEKVIILKNESPLLSNAFKLPFATGVLGQKDGPGLERALFHYGLLKLYTCQLSSQTQRVI